MTPTVMAPESSFSNRESGYALLGVVVISAVLLVAGGAAISLTRNELRGTADQATRQDAFYVAESGVQHALAQLANERNTANSSTTYTFSGSGGFENGTYSITIGQDPNYPSDPERKLIRSTGTVDGVISEVMAHEFVQPQDGCGSLVASHEGDVRLFGTGAAGLDLTTPKDANLFDGEIFTNPNRDVRFTIPVNLRAGASGTVYAGRDFVSNAPLAVSTLGANLLRGRNYVVGSTETLTHSHLLGGPSTGGVHFVANNATTGHGGTQAPIEARRFPRPDYHGLKHDPRTVIINASNTPVGTWNAGTWEYNGELILGSFNVDPEVIYYVEGNAKIDHLRLAAESRATIVTRGWMTIENLTQVTVGGLCGSLSQMVGPVSAGSSTCVQVDANSVQRLHLIAEDHLVIGYETVDVVLNAATENTAFNFVATVGALGIGTTVANVGGRTQIMGYSEKGSVWALVSTMSAGAKTHLNLCSRLDATLAFAASVDDSVRTYVPGS